MKLLCKNYLIKLISYENYKIYYKIKIAFLLITLSQLTLIFFIKF